MLCLLQQISTIPDVVWSGLLASGLTVTGVLLSDRSNTKRLRLQLQHDAEQKSTERTAALRREVYLRVAEEMVRVVSHLASLPQADLTKVNPAEGMQGFFVAAAKLQMVAEPKTTLLVNRAAADYAELQLKVLEALVPLQRLRIDINIHGNMYDKAQAEVNRIVVEMGRFNETVQVDSRVFQALERAFASYQEQAQKWADKRNAAWEEFNKRHVDFQKDLHGELLRLNTAHIPVMVALRGDLGLTVELDALKAQMEENAERLTKQLERLFGVVQNL